MLHEVITSEKVPFTYRVAGLGSRFLAWLIDLGLIVLLTFVVLVLANVWERARVGLGLAVLLVAAFVLQWGYFVLFEWLWNGQTPGKWVVGIRVVRWQGTAVNFGQSAVRNVLRIVDGLPLLHLSALGVRTEIVVLFEFLALTYGLGFLVAVCNRAHRRLGDLAAGTLVVFVERKERPIRTVYEQDNEAQRRRMTQVRQRLDQLNRRQKQTILDLCLRSDQLRVRDRARLFSRVTQYFKLEHDLAPQEYESEERFVRQLAAVLTSTAR